MIVKSSLPVALPEQHDDVLLFTASVSLCLPEQHDILAQLLNGAWGLHICLGLKALDEGVHNSHLAQGLGMGLQPLVAAGYCLSTLQPTT